LTILRLILERRAAQRHLLLAIAMVALSFTAPVLAAPSEDTESAADGPLPASHDGKARGFARFIDPADGQFDLSAFLAQPHAVLPIPVIVTEPAVGYGGGAFGAFLRPRENVGSEGWARPNLSLVGGLATENGTWLALAGDSSRWVGGRLQTLVAAAAGKLNLDFYGGGLGLPQLDQPVRYSLDVSGAIVEADWQVSKGARWAVGLRYVFTDVTPELRDAPAFPDLPDRTAVTISAPTAILKYDSRNNIFTPTQGLYSETSYLVSRDSFGATVDFERLHETFLAWQPLPHDITLGERADYAWASTSTPFFLRPYIQLRGVPAMRYQGDEVASLEVEARWQFYGRWSAVPFAGIGATDVRHAVSESNGQTIGSGGIGFRYELASKFGLHAGLDLAHSPGTTAVYIQFGNAWFRP
jgi:hypothetical protein